MQNPCNPLKMPPEASPKGMDVGSVLARIFVGMIEAIVGGQCIRMHELLIPLLPPPVVPARRTCGPPGWRGGG